MKNSHKENGFTLIELLLVVGLLAVSVGVTGDILVSLIRANSKTQVMNEIEEQSNFISLKIEKELRDAKYVALADGNNLEFQIRDGTDITYSLSNSILTRKEGSSGTVYNLTSNSSPGGVSVGCSSTNGCFYLSSNSPQVVNISLLFSGISGGVSYSGSSEIETSVVIRNTY